MKTIKEKAKELKMSVDAYKKAEAVRKWLVKLADKTINRSNKK